MKAIFFSGLLSAFVVLCSGADMKDFMAFEEKITPLVCKPDTTDTKMLTDLVACKPASMDKKCQEGV